MDALSININYNYHLIMDTYSQIFNDDIADSVIHLNLSISFHLDIWM